jgi:hypothetical protein
MRKRGGGVDECDGACRSAPLSYKRRWRRQKRKRKKKKKKKKKQKKKIEEEDEEEEPTWSIPSSSRDA